MDPETQAAIEKLTVLFAQTESRIFALQMMVEESLNLGQREKAAFRHELVSWEKRYLRLKIESAEDVDPQLAIRLQRVLMGKSKRPKAE